jgi:hypothetical protein
MSTRNLKIKLLYLLIKWAQQTIYFILQLSELVFTATVNMISSICTHIFLLCMKILMF